MDERPKIKILKKGIPKEDIPTAPRPKAKNKVQPEKELPKVKETKPVIPTPQGTNPQDITLQGQETQLQSSPKLKKGKKDFLVQALINFALILLTVAACYFIWGNNNSSEDTTNIDAEVSSGSSGIILPEYMNIAKSKGYLSNKDILRERISFRNFLQDLRIPGKDISDLNRMAEKAGLNYLFQGDKITLFHDSLSKDNIKYIIVEKESDPYYFSSFNLDNELAFDRTKKFVETKTVYDAAIIEGNLAQTFNKHKFDNELAKFLEDAFRGQFDFFNLEDGDRFKMLYDREFVNGTPGKILQFKGMYFRVGQKEYYAFNHNSRGKADYYNSEGQSLKTSFLLSPIEYGGVITSGFGLRTHPVLKYQKDHRGTDYWAPIGTQIQSIGQGEVLKVVADHPVAGNFIEVRHGRKYKTRYLHLEKFASGMRKGTRVNQGQVIGYLGKTGRVTGAHVHFEFWKDNEAVNHLKENLSGGKRMPVSELDNYRDLVKDLMAVLERVEYF